ncbi:sialidase [Rhodopirellula sallentina SM41]|uniref:Sialidase n=1 Tax=Rhodopirellula sallentina SM41 TaxID=1263870 RepID=M5U120_9BACT|nr:sialidase [Rhodopirellula sallentina SM41]
MATMMVGPTNAQDLLIERSVIVEGDSEWDWNQARTGYVPGEPGLAFTTMSRTSKTGSHGYHDIYFTTSRDHGASWDPLKVIPTLRRAKTANGYEVVAGDLWPNWHAASGKILLNGKTFNFAGGTKEDIYKEQVFYAVVDPQSLRCGPLKTLEMPERDHAGQPIIAPNAGCHQAVFLDNGDILMPIRYQRSKHPRIYVSIVSRCRFDGETLSYVEHGTEHTIPKQRGLYEPSAYQFDGETFLTMRADDGAYVSKSTDGINFTDHIAWKFDDGKLLGSRNTQQHWATIGGRLYLVYTRENGRNGHIMRNRAPLYIAQVDPERLHVIRDTEQVIVPENHATLGNSGVCRIHENETWVTVAEGLVSHGKRRGENNRVILAKLTAP